MVSLLHFGVFLKILHLNNVLSCLDGKSLSLSFVGNFIFYFYFTVLYTSIFFFVYLISELNCVETTSLPQLEDTITLKYRPLNAKYCHISVKPVLKIRVLKVVFSYSGLLLATYPGVSLRLPLISQSDV